MHLIKHTIFAFVLLYGNGTFAFWSFFGDMMENFSCFKYRCLPWPCCPVDWYDCVDADDSQAQYHTENKVGGCANLESYKEKPSDFKESTAEISTKLQHIEMLASSLNLSKSVLDEDNFEHHSAGESQLLDNLYDFKPEMEYFVTNPEYSEEILVNTPTEDSYSLDPRAANMMKISHTEIENGTVAGEQENTTASPIAADPKEISTIYRQNATSTSEQDSTVQNAADMINVSNMTVLYEQYEYTIGGLKSTTVPYNTDSNDSLNIYYIENSTSTFVENTTAPFAEDSTAILKNDIQNATSINLTINFEFPNAEESRFFDYDFQPEMMEYFKTSPDYSEEILVNTSTENSNASDPLVANMMEISHTEIENGTVAGEQENTTASPIAADPEEISNIYIQNATPTAEQDSILVENAADVMEVSNMTVLYEQYESTIGGLKSTTVPYNTDSNDSLNIYYIENSTSTFVENTTAPYAEDSAAISNNDIQNATSVNLTELILDEETFEFPSAGESRVEEFEPEMQYVFENIKYLGGKAATKIPNAIEKSTTIDTTVIKNSSVPDAANMTEISNIVFENETKTGEENSTEAYAADMMAISDTTVHYEIAADKYETIIATINEEGTTNINVGELQETVQDVYKLNETMPDVTPQDENETIAAQNAEMEMIMETTNNLSTTVSNLLLQSSNKTDNNTNPSTRASDLIPRNENSSSTMLPNVRHENATSGEMCHHFTTAPSLISCPNKKFRTADGTCNNPEKPALGSSGTRYRRNSPQYYDDGIHAPRNKSKNGKELPNARKIVSRINKEDQNQVNNTVNLMFVVWGQFIAYDLIKTHPVEDVEMIECCTKIKPKYPEDVVDCLPIVISSKDRFYSKHNITCLNFVRSYAQPIGKKGYHEQVNAATAYLDASIIYGSRQSETDRIGISSYGDLETSNDFESGETMKIYSGKFCQGIAKSNKCIVSGDNRVNQHGGLAMLFFLFHRQHNKIIDQFKKNLPLDGKRFFQEARKIIGAMIQHITYNEYLPILLDKKTIVEYQLKLQKAGKFSDDYDYNVDPSIANEFATAAFRFGQTQVTKNWIYPDSTLNGFRDTYNPAESFLKGRSYYDYFRYQLAMQPNCKKPNFMTKELTEHLFEEYPRKYGLDLASFNIQRGRDHGIAPYSTVRSHYNLSQPKSFEDLSDLMDAKIIKRLKRTYPYVEDIDLFVGGYLEKPLTDGHLGQTFIAIIADQFRRLRQGDQYWYELGNRTSSFTIEQLDAIRKVTLAGLLCESGERTAKLAMRVPCPKNPIVACDEIEAFDLSPWLKIGNKTSH